MRVANMTCLRSKQETVRSKFIHSAEQKFKDGALILKHKAFGTDHHLRTRVKTEDQKHLTKACCLERFPGIWRPPLGSLSGNKP